ncbi:preprotein translocase subunit SecG [Magnetospirillum fulvum]|uniref:Protein-export membrane protein SecG n=1 Tax=Magnetospirillum fulvum TaxID=1082 RepID=A0A1H6HP96_MAGFU|nr:preprotein translocase subunit SecG [Magnetospirillum fulvum]SEH37649.1 protein translocase subunit secG [Magnetospirillum fulvum]
MDFFPIILVIHILLALALVGVILLQRSEGGALGIGGNSGGGLMSGRSAGNLLTRTTAIIATLFFSTSMVLALIASHRSGEGSPFDKVQVQAPVAPAAPAEPAAPSAPLAR